MILHTLIQNNLIDCPKWVINNQVYTVISGSQLYGISTPDSDFDIHGVTLPLKELMFPTLIQGWNSFKIWEGYQKHHILYDMKEYDVNLYSLPKFVKLAYENNPNILELLFAPNDVVLYGTPIGQIFRDNRKLFLSKECFHKQRGYAQSNLHKLSIKKPEEDSKRKILVDKFGYDTKYAANAVRLFYNCYQILTENDLDVRINKDFILQIRNGILTLKELLELTDVLNSKCEYAFQYSKIQEKPPFNKIEQLLYSAIELQYGDVRNKFSKNEDLLEDLKKLVNKYE